MAVEPFDPPVKSSSPYTADGSSHARNWNALARFLDTAFVGSGQVSSGAIGTDQLADGAVTDAKITDVSISKLTDGTLFALGTLIGGWITAGGEIRFDGDGLVFTKDGATFFSLRPGEEPFFRGQVEALGLLVENDFVLRGTNNLIEAGATIVMGGAATGQSVGNPGAAPGLSVIRDTFELDDDPLTDIHRGLFFDATNTSWWTTEYTSTSSSSGFPGLPGKPVPPFIKEFDNDATHTLLRAEFIPGAVRIYGVVRLGTRVYVLMRHDNGDVYLRAYQESNLLVFLGQVNVTNALAGGVRGQPALGVVGSSLMVVDLNASGNITFNEFLAGDVPTFNATVTSSGTGNPTLFVGNSTLLTGFVVAESAWWVGIMDTTGRHDYRVEKFASSTGVYVQDQRFESGQAIRGLAHDGTNFHTLGDERVVKHSNWNWTTESDRYHVAYTYVDDNGTASVGARPLGAGDFETKKSPTAAVTVPRRAKLRASAAAVDTALTGITHVGWYIERGASEPTLDYQADSAVTNGVQTTRTIDTFSTDASPEAPPGSNTFPDTGSSSTYATFESSDGSPILRADGLPRMKVTQANNQAFADVTVGTLDWASITVDKDTDSFADTANDRIDFPFTGQYLLLFTCRWSANATGYRRVICERSPDGSAWTSMVSEGASSNISPPGTVAPMNQISIVVSMTAGHFIRLRGDQNSGASRDIQDWNLQVIFLGPA